MIILIYIPSTEELETILLEKGLNFKVESRIELDSNPFSNLEIIKFINQKEEYVLKSIHPLLKSEAFVHDFVNKDALTASPLLVSSYNTAKDQFFILMEKIQFEPLYFFPAKSYLNYYETIAKKLAHFHLKNMKSLTKFKEMDVEEFGWSKYEDITINIGSRVEKIASEVDHHLFLNEDLVKKFQNYVPSLITVLEPVKTTKLTLVHGDFDTGNLIVKKIDNEPYAIDYGLAHIDIPVIDIAHLLSATDMSINKRRDIFEAYFDLTSNLYPDQVSMQDVRQAGRIMHMLFFLDWYLKTIEKKIVPADYFLEQIHGRVSLLTDLLKIPHD